MWTVNGVNPNTLGLKVESVPGWESAPALDYLTQQVPGKAGNILLRVTPQIGARRLTVNANVVGTSNADMLTKLDAIKALFAPLSLVVVMDNRPTRSITCRLDGSVAIDPGETSMLTRKIAVTFTLVADDPWWYDIATTSMAEPGAGVGTSTPLGTAPSLPVLTATFTGSVAFYTITLYNSAGVQVGVITFTRAFVNTDVLVVDMANRTVTVNGVNALTTLSAGDFFALDAALHGNYGTSAWPSILKGAGATMNISYKKAWR
jgi:phage-related protein